MSSLAARVVLAEAVSQGDIGAKPRGCRIFPAYFTDDGAAVRVSATVECACVLASLGKGGGAPLVPTGARREADLEPGCHIARLPERIWLTVGRDAARSALRSWALGIEAEPPPADGVAALWALADAVAEGGLDFDAMRRALETAEPPPAAALGYRLRALAALEGERSVTSVISAVLPSRIGGPQKPVPWLT